jgi:hypothetical protein
MQTRPRLHLPLLVLALALAAGCSRAEPPAASDADPSAAGSLSLPLEVASNGGCLIERGEFRLFDRIVTQSGGKPLVLEAEDALRLFFQADVFARRAGDDMLQIKQPASEYKAQTDDPEASGGGYVDYCQDGRLVFNLVTPGRYTIWARHWIPREATWNYNMKFDDQDEMDLAVSGGEGIPSKPAKQWYWVRGGEVDLQGGTHELRIKNLNNGKRLDKIILSPDPKFVPEGASLAASPFAVPNSGSVTFRPVAPAAFRSWNRVEIERLQEGAVTFDASVDGGKTWNVLPADLSLSGLALPAGEPPPLTLRMTLAREGGAGPRLRAPAVSYAFDPEQWVVLRDDQLELFLSRKNGSLSGIRHRKSGRAFSPVGANRDLFELLVKEPGKPERKWITMREATLRTLRQNGNTAVLEWDLPESMQVRMEIRLPGNGRAEWDVTVVNGNERLDVMEVNAPKIGGLRIADNAEDDTLIWPFSSGEFIPFPASRGEMTIAYLDHGGFPFIDLYTPDMGFYFAVQDPFLTATLLTSKAAADQQSIEVSATRRQSIRPGTEQTYRFALAVHDGDWHAGAKIYRDFFYRHYPVNTYTPVLRDTDAWVVGGAVGHNNQNPTYQGILGDYLRAAWWGTLHMQGWGSIANGACPTYYMPRLELGGEEDFAKTVQTWRKAGGSTGYYFHGNSITPYFTLTDRYFKRPWSDYPAKLRPRDWKWIERNLFYGSEDWKPPREEWLAKTKALDAKRRAGEPVDLQAEENATGYVPMTWSNEALGDYLLQWIDRYVRLYHNNTAYLDTFAFYGENADYNPYEKLHGETARSMANRMAFLDRLFTQMRKHEPSFVALCEGVGDVFGSRLFYLLSGFAKDGNILRYTLPDQIYFQGQCNGLWTPEMAWHSTSSAYLMGNRFDNMHGFPAIFHLTRLRQRVSPFINHAVFDDTIGLTVPDGVRAFAHVLSPDTAKLVPNDGSRTVALTFLNETGGSGEATYRLPEGFTLRRAFLVEMYGDPAPLAYTLEDGVVRFAASKAAASAVVLIDQVVGSEQWTALTQPLDRETIGVDLFNFSDREMTFVVAARYPTEAPTWQDRQEIRLAPGGVSRVLLKDSAPGDVGRLVPIEVTDGEGLSKPLISLFGKSANGGMPPAGAAVPVAKASPPPKSNPVVRTGAAETTLRVDFEEDPEAGTEKPHQGARALELKGNGKWQGKIYPLELEPGATYRVSAALRKGFNCSPIGHNGQVAVCNYTAENKLEHFILLGGDQPRDDRWHVVAGNFIAGPNTHNTGLYLYNNETMDSIWYDDLVVEKIRPSP